MCTSVKFKATKDIINIFDNITIGGVLEVKCTIFLGNEIFE